MFTTMTVPIMWRRTVSLSSTNTNGTPSPLNACLEATWGENSAVGDVNYTLGKRGNINNDKNIASSRNGTQSLA